MNPSGQTKLTDTHQPSEHASTMCRTGSLASGWRLKDTIIALILAGVALAFCLPRLTTGGFDHPDAAEHAWQATQWIGQIQGSQSIPETDTQLWNEWPTDQSPLFTLLLAGIFAVAEPSVLVARCLTVATVIAAVVLLYILAGLISTRRAAVATALLTLSAPIALTTARNAESHWLALAFMSACLIGYLQLLRRPALRWSCMMAAAAVSACLTNAIGFLVILLIAAHVGLQHTWSVFNRKKVIIPSLIGFLLILAWYVLLVSADLSRWTQIVGSSPREWLFSIETWMRYLNPSRIFPDLGAALILGIVIAAVVGLYFLIVNYLELVKDVLPDRNTPVTAGTQNSSHGPGQEQTLLPTMALLLAYIACTIVVYSPDWKLFYIVPAASLLVSTILGPHYRKATRLTATGILVALCVTQLITAIRQPVVRLNTTRPTIASLIEQNATRVFVSTRRHAQFQFDLHRMTARGHRPTIYTFSDLRPPASPQPNDQVVPLPTPKSMIQWLTNRNIECIVIDKDLPATLPPAEDAAYQVLLRETVSQRQLFTKVASQPLSLTNSDWGHAQLIVYRFEPEAPLSP